MEKVIEHILDGKKASEVTVLDLDNCKSDSLKGLTEEFVNLEDLSLYNVGLSTLEGFPKLPALKKLELGGNDVAKDLAMLQQCPNLTHLSLTDSKISSLEVLEPLKKLKHLIHLDVYNNDVTSDPNYSKHVFDLIPSLVYLDGVDAHGTPAPGVEKYSDSVDGDEEVDSDEGEEDEDDDDENDEEVEDDDDVDDEEDEEEENGLGLSAVYKDNLEEESEGEDYEGGDAEDDEDEDVEDEEDESSQDDSLTRGKKRKHAEEEEDGEN